MKKIVEICCGGYYDARQAHFANAERIELNSALHLGGLTPSLGTLIKTKEHTELITICMVRPRGGGFHYKQEDIDTMLLDAKLLLDNDADGIAFGFLDEDKTVNKELTNRMVSLIHSYKKEAVFHRAVDVCTDITSAFQDIIDCNCDRILTSGGQDKAMDALSTIKKLHTRFADKIEIVVGSGINEKNALELMQKTGVTQIHSSCKKWKKDPTVKHQDISFYYHDKHPYSYEVVDKKRVAKLIACVK